MKMLPDHGKTEAVDGSDLRAVDQGRLTLQMHILWPVFQLLFNGTPDPFLHLRSRGLRKCDDQETVHIHRMVRIRQKPDDPLHQHRCFSRACRRGYQDIPVPQFDHFFLFPGPLYSHLQLPSFPRSRGHFTIRLSLQPPCTAGFLCFLPDMLQNLFL